MLSNGASRRLSDPRPAASAAPLRLRRAAPRGLSSGGLPASGWFRAGLCLGYRRESIGDVV